jgi:hypothetical protein
MLWKAENDSERLCTKGFGRQKMLLSGFAEKAFEGRKLW